MTKISNSGKISTSRQKKLSAVREQLGVSEMELGEDEALSTAVALQASRFIARLSASAPQGLTTLMEERSIAAGVAKKKKKKKQQSEKPAGKRKPSHEGQTHRPAVTRRDKKAPTREAAPQEEKKTPSKRKGGLFETDQDLWDE